MLKFSVTRYGRTVRVSVCDSHEEMMRATRSIHASWKAPVDGNISTRGMVWPLTDESPQYNPFRVFMALRLDEDGQIESSTFVHEVAHAANFLYYESLESWDDYDEEEMAHTFSEFYHAIYEALVNRGVTFFRTVGRSLHVRNYRYARDLARQDALEPVD